ncbi:MAG: TonB-dependent receptor [Bacteroidia bacterium]|nr:TonB-dependent receptor [Bacteroidia bacterium]MDW8133866.1 TonB-dependent receptor [Bacteroidia bacterium]
MGRYRVGLFLWIGLLGCIYAQSPSNVRRYRLLVKDAQTQEGLAGASVAPLREGVRGAITDSMGIALLGVPTGIETLWVEVRYVGYTTERVPITPRSSMLIEVKLKEEGIVQEEVVISSVQETRTEVSLLAALQQMPQIATGLSAQAIQKTPDRTAAAVLSRVTGVSLNDGRFLVVRGMNERYNPILLNRLPAPSTEPDSRGFDLEILPAGLIDQVRVYKTPTAHQTGDFGGGLVEILTRRSSDKATFHLQFRGSYLQGTTFRRGLANLSNISDLWGGGVSTRSLPSGFPADFTNISSSEAQRWTYALPQNFKLRELSSVPPAFQLSLTYGMPLSRKLWILTGGAYSRSFQTLRVERNRYEVLVLRPGANAKLFSYTDWQTTQITRLFGFANLLWTPRPGQQVETNLFAARLCEDETIIREGFSFYQRGSDAFFRNYSMQYVARTLVSMQLGGMHRLGEFTAIRWDLGGTTSFREEPDFRRVRTVKENGDSLFRIILPPGPTTFDAARFYSSLSQYAGVAQVSLLAEWNTWKFVGGVQGEGISRTFWARWFSYTLPANTDPVFIQRWTALPIQEAFTGEYIGQLRLREGTNPTDRYDAQQLVFAPYASVERQLGRLSFQTGLRYEYSQQRLSSATATAPVEVVTPFPLLMPFANLGYSLSATQKLRFAYSRTLNRPSLRELAPFLYYNFALEVQQAGSPSLRPASLHNIDARYEFTPSLDQLVAVGAFYKHIRNPIETYILRGADQPTVQFGNAPYAQLLGLEAEARIRFSQTLSTILNAAYIWSQVDMGRAVYGTSGSSMPSQARFRPLQGQAPYLFNMLFVYTPVSQKWEIATSGQLIGPRLWWVGDNFNPSVFEMPRPIWDAHLRRKLGRGFYIQLQARDILNTPFVFRQDSDLNGSITRKEDVIFRYVRGSEWSLTLGWQL